MNKKSHKNYLTNGASNQPKLYTIKQLCERFNISRQRVAIWAKRGYIDYIRDGRRMLIPETEIPTFIRRIKGWELLTGENK